MALWINTPVLRPWKVKYEIIFHPLMSKIQYAHRQVSRSVVTMNFF